MSARNSNPGPPAQPGVYDALLIVACAGLLTAIIFLALHLNSYAWQVGPAS